MNKQNNCITIEYEITTYGTATYNEKDSAKIRRYMRAADCYIETAIERLAEVGAIAGLPEDIGVDQENCYTYTYTEE